ncbi:MAG TPA: hypothetical protein VH458_04440 [Vicinamibacterales bacterium]
MHHLNWYWIVLELTVAPVTGLLVTLPFWRTGAMIFGNLTGTAVLLGWGFALIFREYVEIDRLVQGCLADGVVCFPDPSAFTRFAIYASIAMVEVFVLFSASLAVERHMRERDYAPEWRR